MWVSFAIILKLTCKSRIYFRVFLPQNIQRERLLSYDFHITFVLALFHDKKCYNCINLFPCILWDFTILGLVLSWWRLLKKLILRLVSRVVQFAKVTWEAHAGSWRVKCQATFRESLRDSSQVASDPWNFLPGWF